MPRIRLISCMLTVLTNAQGRQAISRALAWALLMGGWLALGALGRLVLPLWADGLGLVALWLGTMGALTYLNPSILHSRRSLRWLTASAGSGTALMLAWACDGGGVVPALLAAVSWGVLLVAASRMVRMLRTDSPKSPPPFVPAAVGATLAWVIAGDPMTWPTIGSAISVLAASAVLVLLARSGSNGPGWRTGLFDCALPVSGAHLLRDPGGWPAACARWAMVSMMASQSVTTEWCTTAIGATPSHVVGAHLAAMLLPPLFLHIAGVVLRSRAWTALPMAGGLISICWIPGLLGIMVASLCQSIAWGLAWHTHIHSPKGRCAAQEPLNAFALLAPACWVVGIGVTLADSGPGVLALIHFGLGAVATLGTALSLSRPAIHIGRIRVE